MFVVWALAPQLEPGSLINKLFLSFSLGADNGRWSF